MANHYTFLIHTFYATGHVLPMQAVAKALVDRGHKVVWMTHADQESRVLASGAQFIPTSEVAAVDARLRDVNAPQPTTMDETVEFLFGGRVTAQVTDLRRALAHARSLLGADVDCLLHDAMPHGAAAIHELGEVSMWATLGVVPMWTTEEEARTALGMILSKPEIVLPCLNRQRAELGLKALGPADPLHYSPFLHIQASCPDLEYGRTMPNTHFVGPLVTGKSSSKDPQEVPVWWADVAEHRCVIGITQGTFAVDPTTLLIPAIEALCDDGSLLLVVPSMHATSIRAGLVERGLDMTNVRLAEWVPYDLLLPKCRILITNGGYGSVTQSLSHGVPMICAGTSEDKKDTAARMVSVGAGVDLGTDTPSSAQIKAAVQEVLANEKYRNNAANVGKVLNQLGGAQKACELLEGLIAKSETS